MINYQCCVHVLHQSLYNSFLIVLNNDVEKFYLIFESFETYSLIT